MYANLILATFYQNLLNESISLAAVVYLKFLK